MGKNCDWPAKGNCRPEKTRRRPPHPGGCCPEGGYIVERIVCSDRAETCFEGLLQIEELPDCLCPPLCLRGIDVMQVDTVCGGMDACCTGRMQGMQRLRLTLCCYVTDSRGCRAEGVACIEIQTPGRRRNACGVNVRRGAEAFIRGARFCPPCAFDVCLNICVSTVVSRCEMTGPRLPCPPPCPDLPLYPQPIAPPYRCRRDPCEW